MITNKYNRKFLNVFLLLYFTMESTMEFVTKRAWAIWVSIDLT